METHKDRSRPTREALAPGELIDHYQVVRLLGRGGMGEVYLARDTKLGRKAALKVVRGDVLVDDERLEQFLVEARVTARFNHPHIVTVYGVGARMASRTSRSNTSRAIPSDSAFAPGRPGYESRSGSFGRSQMLWPKRILIASCTGTSSRPT